MLLVTTFSPSWKLDLLDDVTILLCMWLWAGVSEDKGVSVQDGLRFYDDQKATMPRILDYGGWCWGMVNLIHRSACSKFPTHWMHGC